MSRFDDLWQKILAAPADPDLKTQYVAALSEAGDRRAQIFSLATEYEQLRSGSFIDRAAELKPRLDELIAQWRAEFAPRTSAWPGEIRFVLGWPIELTIKAADFARHAGEVVATLPIRHLNLLEISASPGVFDVPQLKQIASLDGSNQPWSDDALRALARSSRLGALRWLNLSRADISEAQVEVLAGSAALKDVQMLDLTKNPTRDPVDAASGYGTDWMTNRIVLESVALPTFGYELEARHGKITWLHGLWNYLEDYPPSRYSF
jgi:hypothetical protein